MSKIIYILTNEAMPNYVKIGKTDNLKKKIRSLNTTSIPLPFKCFYACTVDNADFVEEQLHNIFSDRIRSKHEFFEVTPDRVVSALKLAEIKNVTSKMNYTETQKPNKVRAKRPAFNFKMVNIPIGAELSFSNDENIKATVIDNRYVEVDGEKTSLSASAQKLLGRLSGIRGPAYWKYKGETLVERRRRMESED